MARRAIAGSQDNTVERVVQRQGVRIPTISPGMDRFLRGDDLTILYERWQDDWPEPLGLPGGGKLINTAMVRELTWQQLSNIYGAKRAKVYRDIAQEQV